MSLLPGNQPHLSRRLKLAMWLAFIAAPVVIGYGAYENYRATSLARDGETIAATLVNHQTLDTGKGRTSYSSRCNTHPRTTPRSTASSSPFPRPPITRPSKPAAQKSPILGPTPVNPSWTATSP